MADINTVEITRFESLGFVDIIDIL